MNLKHNLSLYILVVISVSCMKNIEFDTGEFSHQPVVNAIICAGDTAKIFLSYSFPSYDENGVPNQSEIDTAFVQISDNMDSIYHFTVINAHEDHASVYVSNLIPSVNETYQLRIFINGFESLESTTTIPNAISIDSIGYTVVQNDIEEGLSLQLSTWFKDPPSDNFYYYKFSISGGEWQPYWIDSIQDHGVRFVYAQELFDIYWETHDPLIGEINKFMKNRLPVFTDHLINDMSYDLKIDIPLDASSEIFNYDSIMFSSVLYSIPPDFYYYSESINQQYASRENPFVEPVPDYTNIKNARGIFAGISNSVGSIRIATSKIKAF